jgi:hypothetical protein
MADAAGILEQAAGALLFAAIGADVFLTVLYARIGSRGLARLGAGLLSMYVARAARSAFHAMARRSPHRDGILSFYGPLALVGMAASWAIGFALACALVLHPHLGTTMVVRQGPTPTADAHRARRGPRRARGRERAGDPAPAGVAAPRGHARGHVPFAPRPARLPREGARRYIEMRSRWQRHIEDLGDHMAFRREEIDPAAHPEARR